MKLLKTDTLKEAQDKLMNATSHWKMKTRVENIEDAFSMICAKDIYSNENIPPFRRSTVDGYAIKASDTFGASEDNPLFFDVKGEILIDESSSLSLNSQEVVQVQTGSMIPLGADAVMMVEYCEEYVSGRIAVFKAVSVGENINEMGEDIQKDECIVHKGQTIDAYVIGVLTSLGISQIEVYNPLTISIFSTGDELIDINEQRIGSHIYDTNSYVLSCLSKEYGMIVKRRKCLKDHKEMIQENIEQATKDSDLVIVSGGSSKGNKDYTVEVFEDITHCLLTHGIAMKPGKPTMISYDQINQTILVGLPGHPMAAAMMFQWIVGHWLNIKRHQVKTMHINAVLQENIASNQGRETCVLVKLIENNHEYEAYPLYNQSGNMFALTKADGYIIIPRLREGLHKGERVKVEVLK